MISISRYSGKCDFFDHLWLSAETEEEAFNKFNGTKLYISQPLPDDFDWIKVLENNVNIPETYYKKVEYSSMKDLIPLYPYIIAMAYWNKENPCSSIVCLSEESFVDSEEKEFLEFTLKRLLTIYNRCKRKKIEFNVDEAVEEITWNGWNEEAHRELANRIKVKGKKATIDGIHLKMQEHYRQELVEVMLRNGLNIADNRYERFIKEV